MKTVRLACLNHAASVHSEPGSNSPKRVLNLVIHELPGTSRRTCQGFYLEYLDWGSQSIVQSKFQRAASFLGERRPTRHFQFLRSIPFLKRNLRPLSPPRFVVRSPPAKEHPLFSARAALPPPLPCWGTRTMELPRPHSSDFFGNYSDRR